MAPRTPVPPAVALNLALAVVASSNAPVLLLDSSLTVIAASKSFCRAFQIEPGQVEGRSLTALGAGEWNVPQVIALLKATASGFAEADGYEMELIRPGRGNRCLILNATKLDYADGDNVRLLLAVSDITEARIAEKLRKDLAKEKRSCSWSCTTGLQTACKLSPASLCRVHARCSQRKPAAIFSMPTSGSCPLLHFNSSLQHPDRARFNCVHI